MYICLYTFVAAGDAQDFRYRFMEKSIPSFLKSDFPPNTKIVISDDCSKDSRVRELLSKIEQPKNAEIEFIFRETRLGCDRNMVSTMRHALKQTKDQFIITADSDVLYNPQWINKLIEAKESVPKDIRLGMLTCFETKSHKVIGDFNELLYDKKTVGGFCAFVNRDLVMHERLNIEAWDHSVNSIGRDKGYKFLCTKVSYVQHMGKGKSGNGLSWDTGRNFVGE